MKRRILVLLMAIMAGVAAFAQSAKVVVDSEGYAVGRYVRTNATTYTIITQDECEIPKAGHKVVTYYAEKGDGIVFCSRLDWVNIRNIPSTSGEIIGKLGFGYEADYLTCPCLGKVKGWYKVWLGEDENGEDKIGYIRQDVVEWDAMDTI